MVIILYFLLLYFVSTTFSAQVLILLSIGTKSHFTILEHLAVGLGAKGHQITVASIYPLSDSYPNVKEYQIPIQQQLFTKKQQQNAFTNDRSAITFFNSFTGLFGSSCRNLFTNPLMIQLLDEIRVKGKVFDVAIVNGYMNECTFSLAAIAANHTMVALPVSIPQWIAYYMNIPFPTSIVPSVFSPYVPPMTFSERFHSTLIATGFFLFHRFVLLPEMQETVDLYLPEGTPNILDSMRKSSFILSNSDPIYSVPRPSLPFVADIGGIHLRSPKPLPKEFHDFINTGGDSGVIVFALGSYVQAKFLPQEIKSSFLTAFSNLKQKVIWKFEEEIHDLPANIKIVQWMPLQDILGHPNVRLFITHCGRLSLQEATYHAVPVIGIPLFGDQPHNIAIVKQHGIGEELEIHNITADWVYTLIQRILNDKRYKDNSKAASAILRDRIRSPIDTANYWLEYIIRHNGAPFLKNSGAQELSLFQYFLLDVFAVIIFSIAIGISIFVTFFVFLWKLFIRKNSARKQKSK